MKRFPYFKSAMISMGLFSTSVAWSAYSVYVPLFARQNLIAIMGQQPIINTLVGIIMILDNIAALFIQPYVGELSDRTWIPKLGRRMPFVIIGIPLAATFFGLIGTFHDIMYLFIIAIIGFNVSMAFYKTPVMSLLPDHLPKEYRSQGSGVLNVATGIANLTGLLVSSYFYKNHTPASAFWVLGAIMVFCLILLIFNVREKKGADYVKQEEKVKIFKSLKTMFSETNRTVILMLVAIFFLNSGYYVGETFLSSYVSVVLGFSDYAAAVMLGVFMGFVILSAIPAGYLGRRIGPINATLIGIGGFIIGITPVTWISIRNLDLMKKLLTLNYLLLSWEAVLYSFIIAIVGFCYILASINVIVVIWDLAPQKRVATYTGYFYVFTSLSAIISPFFAGLIFDLVGFIRKGTGLKTLFVYVSAAFVIALLFVTRVKTQLDKEWKKDLERREIIKKERREERRRTLLLETLLFGQILRIRATRKLKRMQREEIQDLKNDFDNIVKGTKEEKEKFKRERKKLRKKHKKERRRFRKQKMEEQSE